jgi:hypothetical protein
MMIEEPPLSPAEIAATLYDSGHVRDRGSAQRLEQRIVAYANAKGTEARTQALAQAVRQARSAMAGLRGANQRAAAARVVHAIESLIPIEGKAKEAYALGYRDGIEDALGKHKPDTPKAR